MNMVFPYTHEPFTNFRLRENQEEFKAALAKVESYLGHEYPLIIGGVGNLYFNRGCNRCHRGLSTVWRFQYVRNRF